MAKIILVRHAQASLGKSNYDELSELGLRQAEILGRYIEKAGWQPDTIISGELVRHKQTTERIVDSLSHPLSLHQDADWNEFDFNLLIRTYLRQHPDQIPGTGDIRAFFSVLKKAMLAWSEATLVCEDADLESWKHFSSRITRAISNAERLSSDRPTLIVTSGGAIAMLLKQILEINAKTMINLNFQIRNTSFTEVHIKSHKQSLAAFNQVNHLSEKQYQDMLTYA